MRRVGRNRLLAFSDKYRIYVLFVVVFALMSALAPIAFWAAAHVTCCYNAA